MPLFALAAALASAPLVQQDARAAAQLEFAKVLQANVEGADTPFGWVPDLLTFSVLNDGCTTYVTRHQRRIYRGSSYIRAASDGNTIRWGSVLRVVWTSMAIPGRTRTPSGSICRAAPTSSMPCPPPGSARA